MSNLTTESILATMREWHAKYPAPEPSPFRDFFRPMFGGLKVYEKPPPPPKIQLSAECAELVGDEFAHRMNAWLAERFGLQEDCMYLMSGFGIIASKRNIGMITNLMA